MIPFVVALDWTPCSNHAGFFLSLTKGWFRSAGLDVKFISPHENNYESSPVSRLLKGEVDLAICAAEDVISSHSRLVDGEVVPGDHHGALTAVAAVLTTDTSAIVTLKSSGIDRPRKLQHKRYASYGSTFEHQTVRALIMADGGTGEFIEDAEQPYLGMWNTLLQGTSDATWVFMGWEGVIAQHNGVDLNVFSLSEYQIPYAYSPLMVSTPDVIQQRGDAIKVFLSVSALGWKYVAMHPAESAKLVVDAMNDELWCDAPLPDPVSVEVMERACEYLTPHILTANGEWGVMEAHRWDEYIAWLEESDLLAGSQNDESQQRALNVADGSSLQPRLKAADLYTNELLL